MTGVQTCALPIFKTFVNDLDCEVYMNVSPELYLKRLIVGGIERVYTFARSFRNEGIDRTHYPEFTLMECYMSYADYEDMMRIMEGIYEHVFMSVNGSTKIKYGEEEIDFKAPWKRETMCNLVKQDTDIDVENLTKEEIVNKIKSDKIDFFIMVIIVLVSVFVRSHFPSLFLQSFF